MGFAKKSDKNTDLQGFGKRMDHFWGNCCLTFIRPGIIFLKSIHEILWALPTNQTTFFNEPIGTTISLLPFTPEVHNVLTQDFAYPLRQETLYQNARAISNVVSGKQPSIRFGSGKLAAYILHKDF